MSPRKMVVIAVVLTTVVTACGSDNGEAAPTEEDLDAVYAEVAGLDPAMRMERLAELAAEEDRSITLYTTMNIDDAGAVLDDFEERYGIDVDLYRASASTVLQRTLQEAEAGFAGADVVAISAAEMTVLDESDLLLELDSPFTADIVPTAVHPNWAGVYLNVFAASWNADVVDPATAPATWEEVLTEYEGRLVLELSDYDWFAALVTDYFVAQLGYEADDAVALFETAAVSASAIEGHSLMAELLAAGEFDVAASTYQHGVERFRAKGAPLAWEPAVEPLVMRPTGIGVHRAAQAPATALLFTDYMLSEAQPLLAELHRTPASQSVAGGLPPGYDVIAVDAAILGPDREQWEARYEEIIRAAADRAGQ